MKRQSAISTFFRPISKRVLEVNVPGELSEDSIDMQQAAASSNIDNESSVPSTGVTDPPLENIDDENRTDLSLFLHHSTAVPCQNKCHRMKAVLCNESGSPSLHGFAATRMEPAIVHAVCIQKQLASKNNWLSAKNTEGIHKSRWAKETNGWQDYQKGKSALRSHNRYPWHQAATDALHVCMANFRALIATLKYHRCYRLFAMQPKVHQPSFY